MVKKSKHADGTLCPEGIALLPSRFRSCCEFFESHTRACYFDLRFEWWSKARGWFIAVVPQAGGGGVAIHYCPNCGSALTAQARRAATKQLVADERP
jgi:hypothetical protein